MNELFSTAKTRDDEFFIEQNVNRAKSNVKVDRFETCFAGKRVSSESALEAAMRATRQAKERPRW